MALHYDKEMEAFMASSQFDMLRPLYNDLVHIMDGKTMQDIDAVLEIMNFYDLKVDTPDPEIDTTDYMIQTEDGEAIKVRWYRKTGSDSKACVVFAHGGGRIGSTIRSQEPVVNLYVKGTGVPFLSVEYRKPPQYPGEIATRDVFSAVKWVIAHADELGVDPGRIAVMGISAGAGMAAGAAILARDEGVELERQILNFPMLDDRTYTPDPEIADKVAWTYEVNKIGWYATLGDDLGGDNVSPITAPARNTNWVGLAPAFIDIGEIDIFRDESVNYALNLWKNGVAAELHVYEGATHVVDMFPIAVAARGLNRRMEVISAL